MNERHFALPAGGAYSLTDETVSALLDTKSGDAARVYLYLLQKNGTGADKSICDRLGLSMPALSAALAALQKSGLLSERPSPVRLPSDTRPDYTGREVASHMERDLAFRHVAEETQRRLGRVFSSNDLQVLFGLYDWRGFSPGMISLLVSFCLEDAERRWGPGRPPTMRQIDKQAAVWESNGINTEEGAERYIQEKEASREAASLICRALGIAGRSPSPTEERYLSEWSVMGFPVDTITLAYDKTVLKTGGLNWKYMHTILKSWKEKGLQSRDDVEKGDVRPAQAARFTQTEKSAAPAMRDKQAMENVKRYLENG